MDHLPSLFVSEEDALTLDAFRDMDYYAVEHFSLPIELMMENAGLHLARVIAHHATAQGKGKQIHFGIGPGNNGGGGLVAARRLAAWGYDVTLDLLKEELSPLPATQLERALKFGATQGSASLQTDVLVDAYLGFSQRPPLRPKLITILKEFNAHHALRISLDLPTGLFEEAKDNFFAADIVLTLAAPKKILYHPALKDSRIYIADLGIPKEVYDRFKLPFTLDFGTSAIHQLKRREG